MRAWLSCGPRWFIDTFPAMLAYPLEERIADLGKTIGGTDKAKAMLIERQPMGRLGKPSEIAMLAVYLASDESAFTTGTMQVIDGGWTL